MINIRAKKSLGQHFLKDKEIARKISDALSGVGWDSVLEIGPGTGILTEFLMERNFMDFRAIEIDEDSVNYLKKNLPDFRNLVRGDFLKFDIRNNFRGTLAIIGNFPYNISSQILFRILEHRDIVVEVTGMFQKEVAERICSGPGSRTYGILSVLIQAFYGTEYLFTISENSFIPAPRVKSAVIRLKRNEAKSLDCDERLFFRVVKTCFGQRRKMLRNSLRSSFRLVSEEYHGMSQRPEQLSPDQFIELTKWVAENSV